MGGCANEGEPRVKITPVGGYVTYVGDGSLHEHWKRANFVPGGNFHRANTHTHTRARTHVSATHKAKKYTSVWIYTSMRRRGRVFLAAWVAFLLTICIYWEGGGRGRAKTSKDLAAILNGNFLFAATDVEAGCSRPDADGPTRVDRFFNRRIRNNFVSAIRVLSICLYSALLG